MPRWSLPAAYRRARRKQDDVAQEPATYLTRAARTAILRFDSQWQRYSALRTEFLSRGSAMHGWSGRPGSLAVGRSRAQRLGRGLVLLLGGLAFACRAPVP